MVAAAVARGYEYYAICDHSHRLRDGRLAEQGAAIERLNARLPIRLLRGVEVNIKADGELDVADDELAGLDWVVASRPPRLRQRPDRAGARRDGEPLRRLHRPPDRPQDRPPRRLRGRPRARDREGARDRDVPRDQLPARPARPQRRPRARGRARPGCRLVIDSDAHQMAALDYVELGVGQARRAWLDASDAGRRTRRTWSEVERACGTAAACTVSFRDDLAAASDWVAAYLEGVGERPGRRGGRSRRDRGAASAPPPRSSPSRSPPCSPTSTESIVPGLTLWNHPRFFAYFANTGSEPGILAELLTAALNVNAMAWVTSPAATELEQVVARLAGRAARAARRACTATSRTPPRPRRSPRSPPRVTLRPGGAVYASEQAHFSVEKAARILGLELRTVPVDDEFRMLRRLPARRRRPRSSPRSGRPRRPPSIRVAELARRCARGGRLAPRRRGLRRLRPPSARSFAGASRGSSRPTRSSSTRTSGSSRRWTARCSGRGGRRRCARPSPPTATTSRPTEGAVDLRDYGPALGRRFRALKLWAVLRCYGREGLQALIREHVRLAALFEGWVRAEPGWEVVGAAAFLDRLLPPPRAPTTTSSPGAATATAGIFVATTRLARRRA